ncbi:MAG: hypothetical protein FWC36_01470 [Spirochaetes bacterium]|nr:hypothetical protein [Spirochaetota bacterium]
MELDIWDDFLTIQFEEHEVFSRKKAHVKGEIIPSGFLMYKKSMRWIEPDEEEVCESQKAKLARFIIDEGKNQDLRIELET